MQMTKEKVIGGFFWTLAERFGAQGISFIVSIILARLLTPKDYGIVAIVTIFTSIANVFVKSGLGTALIQKKDADSIDFASVFYFNICFSIVIYLVMFLISPYIAEYYNNDNLTIVLRVCSISFVLNGINNVQQAYVSKNLEFKKFFFSTAIGTVISAIVGIIMAYCGCGVWALVVQQLLNQVIDTIILRFTIDLNLTLEFSWKRLKRMYSFGWKILVSELVSSVYGNLQALVIGKKYSSEDLALYNKGNMFPQILVRNLDNSIQSVAFPLLSSEQDDRVRFRHLMFRTCTMSYFFICPMMVGMIIVAKPLVYCLLTETWLGCVPYLQLYCITYLLRPIETSTTQGIYALGRSDIALKLDIAKKAYGVIGLIIAVILFDSVSAICISLVICTVLNTCVNMVAISKLVNYLVIDQLRSIAGITFVTALMGVMCWIIGIICMNISPIVQLMIQVIFGVICYVVLSFLFRLQAFDYIVNYLKTLLKKNKTDDK